MEVILKTSYSGMHRNCRNTFLALPLVLQYLLMVLHLRVTPIARFIDETQSRGVAYPFPRDQGDYVSFISLEGSSFNLLTFQFFKYLFF